MNELTRQTKFTTENADVAKGLIKMANAIKTEDKQDPNKMEKLKQNL